MFGGDTVKTFLIEPYKGLCSLYKRVPAGWLFIGEFPDIWEAREAAAAICREAGETEFSERQGNSSALVSIREG